MSEGKKKLTAEELEALWQQAGLSNDLMFRFVMENPILCQRTVSLLLGKQIGRITEQQTQFSIETDGRLKGIRLDLFVEVDGEMVDVEIQTVYLSKKEMGHRLRFYQSELDQMGIRKGQKYKDLKRSIIIFICTYDPFGKGIGRYTFEEVCQEYTDIILDDGITKIIYNTLGTLPEDDKNKTSLEHLFKYINGGEPEDDLCRDLDAEVKKQRQDVNKKGAFVMWEQILTEREQEAEKKGKIEILIALVKDKIISIAEAAKRANMTEAEFSALVQY